MTSTGNKKRSVIIMNKRTSVCLEDSFWHSLHAIVRIENTTIEQFIANVKLEHDTLNLSSSIRVAVLDYFQRVAVQNMPVTVQTDTPRAPMIEQMTPDKASRRQRDRVVAFWSGMRNLSPQLG